LSILVSGLVWVYYLRNKQVNLHKGNIRSCFMEMVKEFLDILACPTCKGPLQDAGGALVCQACRLQYPIRNGIPILLAEEASTLNE
jgi:uncharacterized protein